MLSLISIASVSGSVIQLDDASFEHDTQAATGATTGDWLVGFGTPSDHEFFGAGKLLDQISEEAAGRYLVAKVDLATAPALKERFQPHFKGPRAILFFRRGYLYEFPKPGEATRAAVASYAAKGYASSVHRKVPPEPSLIDQLKKAAAVPFRNYFDMWVGLTGSSRATYGILSLHMLAASLLLSLYMGSMNKDPHADKLGTLKKRK